jgi:hypothetical protein
MDINCEVNAGKQFQSNVILAFSSPCKDEQDRESGGLIELFFRNRPMVAAGGGQRHKW